jgi:hypothetical protein
LGGSIAFVNPGPDLPAILSEPNFLFVEHRNRALHEFIDGFVGAALDILLNQVGKLGPKVNFDEGILLHAK